MVPEGQGQIIVGVGYIAASRTFDRSGKSVPAPSFDKVGVGAYAEYGLSSWLTLVLAPTLATMRAGTPGASFTGSDESGVGARVRLYADGARTIAVQALIEPPLGGRAAVSTERAFGGPTVPAADLRLQLGQSFTLFGWPGFVDIEPGARVRGDGWPTEARFDLAFGLRPRDDSLVLAEAFTTMAPRRGALIASTQYCNLQLSLVFDVARSWSVQVGALGTVAGRNAAREVGPVTAIWYHF
jgi:hypothetical protein